MIEALGALQAIAREAPLPKEVIDEIKRRGWYTAENEYSSIELIEAKLPLLVKVILDLTEEDLGQVPPRDIDAVRRALNTIVSGHRKFNVQKPEEGPLNEIKHGFNDLWHHLISLQLIDRGPDEAQISARAKAIDGLQTQAEDLHKEAKKYVDRLAGKAFSNHFEAEAQALKTSQRFWFFVFVLAAASLAAVGYLGHSKQLDWETRLAVALPAAALLWLAIHHFGIVSSLIRSYRFKSVAAASMDAFRRQLLEDRENGAVAEYLVWAAKQLFTPPAVAPGTTPLEEVMKGLSKDAKDVMKNAAGK
jgi:hypothetical protein